MFRTLRNYVTILFSGSFDPKFYLRENRDVRLADVDPLWHYAKFGWEKGENLPRILINLNCR